MKARFSKQTAINALPPMVRKACDEYIEVAWKARQKIIIRRWSLATCLALNDILHLGDKRLLWVLRGIGDILASYSEENFTSSEARNGSILNGQSDPAADAMQAELLSRRKIHLYIDMDGVPGAVREETKNKGVKQMNHKIKVIIKRPGAKPYVTNISNSLKNLQATVEGHIETVTLFGDMVIICNEEGRLRDLPHNCNVCGVNFVGTIIFCGTDGEEFTDMPCAFADFKKTFVSLFRDKEVQ